MRTFLFSAAVTLCFAAPAQDCQSYWFMTNNAEVQMKVYDPKGKESGTMTWTINNVRKDGPGYASSVKSVFTDEKGKEVMQTTGEYRCNNGVLMADVRMNMPQQQMGGFKPTTNASMETTYLEYPYNMSAGQSLKDVDFKMDADMGTLEFKQTDRKVMGKEQVTTPAGTWDAYKITYNGFFKIKMGGVLGIPMNITATEWFVPGIGVVKTENYNKNGKLTGSTMVSSIKK